MSAITPMRLHRSRARRAFTLIEIIVSLGILSIIGIAFVRLITSQARFTENQMALRNARTVSRNSMNIMLTDLRMVQDQGGLVNAARDSVTVRVPVAFGLLCGDSLGLTAYMQVLPADSAMMQLGWYAGWAYRDSTLGTYSYQPASTVASLGSIGTTYAGNSGVCTDSVVHAGGVFGPGILPMSYTTTTGANRTSMLLALPHTLIAPAPNDGWPVFLYQEITYRFDSSTAYPHRVGLFRKVKAGNAAGFIADEIIAPFDTSAKFKFYVLNNDAAQNAPVADVNQVRGLELNLAGSSPRTPQGKKEAQDGLVTGVFFKNRRDP